MERSEAAHPKGLNEGTPVFGEALARANRGFPPVVVPYMV
jgi:hypothetical protein